jgi:hypothetical protein
MSESLRLGSVVFGDAPDKAEMRAMVERLIREEREHWQAKFQRLHAEFKKLQAQHHKLEELHSAIAALEEGSGDPKRAVALVLQLLPPEERLTALLQAVINDKGADAVDQVHRTVELAVLMAESLEPGERAAVAAWMRGVLQ